jgi:PAS domain S-box-containing protein
MILFLELVGALSVLIALGFLLRFGERVPGRDGRGVMGAVLGLALFFHVGNALDYAAITSALDPIEDFLWVLSPALWGFFFYVCGQESLALRLKESETLVRDLVDTSSQAILVFREGEILYANPAASRLLGSGSAGQLVGVPLRQFLAASEDASLPSLTPTSASREATLRTPQGDIDVDISSGPIQFRGSPAVQLIVSDITARKAAERALKTGARVLSSMVEGVCLSDENGFILYSNPAQEQMFGYGPGELVGKRVRTMHGTDDEEASRLFDAISRSVLERGIWVGELFNRRKDGSTFTSYARITALELEGRKCLLCVAEDLSERKRLEERLLQAHKMESVGRLAGGIAHDFNNLLTVVSGSTELALDRAPDDESLKAPLRRILEASGRATELTAQLLAFARKQRFTPLVMNLNDCVSEAETMLRRLIGEDVDLRTRLEEGLWNVRADRGQLMQVLMNLALNARDAMPAGGELVVETSNRSFAAASDAPIHALMSPGDYVSLVVSDSGTGMTESVLRHVFEPFFTTKEPGKGTGLGLATCYGIVKQNDGFIWATSAPGRGSTFTVYLPRFEGEADAIVPERTPSDSPRGTERVMVVEDEETVRTIIVEVLENLGYEVLPASNGEQALAAAQKDPEPIDLLITDVIMPRMGGRALAERLKATRPDLRVLYISGYPARGARSEDALDRKAVLLEKPFSPLALANKVREILEVMNNPG